MPKSSKRERWSNASLLRMKKRQILFSLLSFSLVSGSIISCKPPGADFTFEKTQLRLSADTIYFDTLISTVKSVTKRLRLYNDESKAVTIEHIGISNSSNAFSIIVNGIEGTDFDNTNLLPGDSLLVLLNANLEEQNQDLPYVIEETLSLTTNANEQRVPVIAWGQDAHFLRDSILVCNSTWTAGKPYVIYDNILVDSLCSLTIEPGTRVYSHVGSNIYIQGTIHSNGTAQEPVVFMNDRFDSGFDTAPGQWGGITFLEGSKDNTFDFTQIRNAQDGIWLGTPDNDTIPDLVMTNSIVENTTGSGVIAFTSDLSMTNCLVDNCGEFAMAGLAGGNYILLHNTFANFGYGFFRNQPVMVLTNNLQLNDGSIILGDLIAQAQNNIIWGNFSDEFFAVDSGDKLFDLTLTNNLIRTTDASVTDGNIVNEDPLFLSSQEFNYRIEDQSPAIDVGLNLGITTDLDSLQRDTKPDLGAYEWREN